MSKLLDNAAPTGLAELNEEAGLVPDDAWKSEKLGQSWRPGDSVNLKFGLDLEMTDGYLKQTQEGGGGAFPAGKQYDFQHQNNTHSVRSRDFVAWLKEGGAEATAHH